MIILMENQSKLQCRPSTMDEPRKIDFDNHDDEKPINLPVYLRIKPLKESEESSLKVIDETTVETNHDGRANKKATFTRVFQGQIGQEQVFDSTTASLLQRFLDGANVMTFAYGVTSSGKTYTIMGNHSQPGLVPRTLEKIFGHYQSKIATSMLTYKPVLFEGAQHLKPVEISELRRIKTTLLAKVNKSSKPGFGHYAFQNKTKDQSSKTDLHATLVSPACCCTVWISVYEIYNEVITDLMLSDCNRSKRKPLTIGQDAKGRTFVKDLIQLPVSSAAEAYSLLQVAKQNLAKASTKLNDNSSRSHMVFNIKMVHWGGSLSDPFVNHFVISDLAGSERQTKTGTSGVLLRQAGAINNSLLVLGRCLEALRKKDRGISAPFRDSKLTRILNPFFTLGGYVSLIICINPHLSLRDETMETIRFSAIASEIVQETIRPLERLRKLRRLTQTCAATDAGVTQEVQPGEVQSWEDAVGFATVHQGVRYLEIRASYFNDMARDILYAEKQLIANEEEIESLKSRLKAAEVSKENIQLMYQDRMKEQRDKFMTLKSELKEFYENEKTMIIGSLKEEIETYEQKYVKYRNGYAKLHAYLEEKLWPEMTLFRERFGHLPEHPPQEGGDDHEKAKPENTIRFWQEKLEETERQSQGLRREVLQKTNQLSEMSNECEELKTTLAEAQIEIAELSNLANSEAAKVKELEDEIKMMKVEFDVAEALNMQVSAFQEELRIAGETREFLVAEYEIKINSLKEEMARINIQLQESAKGLIDDENSNEEDETLPKTCYPPEAYLDPDEATGILQDLSNFTRELNRTMDLISKSGSSVRNIDEKTSSVTQLVQDLDAALASSEAPSACQFLTYIRVGLAQLKQICANGIEPHLKQREDFESQLGPSAQAIQENSQLNEENARLRERLQELQASVAEKDSVITAQASAMEDLRQRVVVNDELKTKAETLDDENQQLRKRLESLRFSNEDFNRKHANALIENQLSFSMDKSLGMSSTGSDISAANESLDKTLTNVDDSVQKPRQRRRLHRENDENSVLDTTLPESILDLSPVRNFRAMQRKI